MRPDELLARRLAQSDAEVGHGVSMAEAGVPDSDGAAPVSPGVPLRLAVPVLLVALARSGRLPPGRSNRRCPAPPTAAQMAELWVQPGPRPRSVLGRRRQAARARSGRRATPSSRSSAPASAAATPSSPTSDREWSAKFPPEAPTEVVASRILWGIGYHQPPIYLRRRVERREGDVAEPAAAGAVPREEAGLARSRRRRAPGPTTRTRSSARRR